MLKAQVTICLLTYNRKGYAEKTLRSTLDNVRTSHPLAVHIADDGSGIDYRQYLREIAGGYANITGVGVTDSERGGYGKNFNLAMNVIHQHSRYVLPLEDDWELLKELDLDPLLEVLDTAPTIGCVRLGYLGFTQAVWGAMEHWVGSTYFVFDSDSPEPHVFAGHPRVEAVAWQRQVGPWKEGLLPGQTEFEVAHRPAARNRVAWPLDLVHPRGDLFAHIGAERAY